MKVLIDADACPVVDLAAKLCRKYRIDFILLCDTAHTIHREGASTLVFDKGADSVDFALVNRVESGDLVITQDYGLHLCALPKKPLYCTRTAGPIQNATFRHFCFSGTNPASTVLPAVA